MTVAAVVLAAGGGSRFSGATHKLLAPLRGRPVVHHALDAAVAAGLDATYLVTGCVDLTDEAAARPSLILVRNPAWAEGMATSLAVAVAAARADGHDAIVVGLGDQPFVEPEAWRRVAASTGTPIAVATYDGRRANPVRLASVVWPRLPTTGDEGARSLLRERPSLVTEVPCPGSAADVDTVEDLARWSS